MTDATTGTTSDTILTEPTLQQKLTAEVLGTLVLVFFGCGSVVYAAQTEARSTITTVGLTFGIAIIVMVYAFGRVSGGHFNPAVSVGAGISGRLPWRQVGLYALAQLAGAVIGALLLFLLMQGFEGFDAEGNMGQNYFGDIGTGYAWWAAFLLEMLLTAVFVTVILAVTDTRNEHPALAPLAIGLTLAAIHFVAIPATGTSVNPARSIGPALFAGPDAIEQLWLFILAPLLGAAVAGLAYPLAFGRAVEVVPGSGLSFGRPRTATPVTGYTAADQYQQQWSQPAAAEPIIQDGWQWDPVGQQWHPVGSTPEQWRAQQAAEQAAQQNAQQNAQHDTAAAAGTTGDYPEGPVSDSPAPPAPGDGYDDGYSDDGYSDDGGTRIRPPD